MIEMEYSTRSCDFLRISDILSAYFCSSSFILLYFNKKIYYLISLEYLIFIEKTFNFFISNNSFVNLSIIKLFYSLSLRLSILDLDSSLIMLYKLNLLSSQSSKLNSSSLRKVFSDKYF